jgi:hypothetical protein
LRGPGDRGELGQAMDGSFGETGEDRRQVFADRDVHPSAGFDDGEDGGSNGRTTVSKTVALCTTYLSIL